MPPGRTAAIGSPTFATAFRSSPTTPILLESRPSAPEADQTECYATATLKWRASDASLRFLFKTTVQLIRCTDVLDPTPRSRELFHDKASLDVFWLKDDSLESLDDLPAPEVLQQEIIEHLEAALASFREVAEGLRREEVRK